MLLTGLRALVFVRRLRLIPSCKFNNIDKVTNVLNNILNWVVQLNRWLEHIVSEACTIWPHFRDGSSDCPPLVAFPLCGSL